MKNIHILPTDKPSRLYLGNNRNFIFGMVKTSIQSRNDDFTNQNIYITSDEEIKEGNWMYYKHFGEDIVTKYNTWGGQNTNVNEHKDYYKKIILTTAQDLIKDGVQAIDDNFLDWFVKNPSCEEVEVIKQELNTDYRSNWEQKIYYKIIIPKEESKQETLEEFIIVELEGYDEIDFLTYERFIKLGAEWQQKRSYSEEKFKSKSDENI